MPAPPVQPVAFAPRRLRVVGVVAAVALVALTFYGWFALPRDVRVLFTVSQLLTLVGFLAALVLVVLGVAASSVRADAEGLRVRNGLRVHHAAWSQVHQIVLRPGDAWAFALLRPDDGPAAGQEEAGQEASGQEASGQEPSGPDGAGPKEIYTADMDTQKRYLVGIQAGDGAYAKEAVAELRRRLTASRATGSRAT
ncbi:MAG: PH domain-containing protein [Janthinobacterium lividum]